MCMIVRKYLKSSTGILGDLQERSSIRDRPPPPSPSHAWILLSWPYRRSDRLGRGAVGIGSTRGSRQTPSRADPRGVREQVWLSGRVRWIGYHLGTQRIQGPFITHNVKIYVRGGGPNYQEGLKVTRLLGECLGVPI